MALVPGTRFGPYEIADQIGKGGMGDVYRATDTKLGKLFIGMPTIAASDAAPWYSI